MSTFHKYTTESVMCNEANLPVLKMTFHLKHMEEVRIKISSQKHLKTYMDKNSKWYAVDSKHPAIINKMNE